MFILPNTVEFYSGGHDDVLDLFRREYDLVNRYLPTSYRLRTRIIFYNNRLIVLASPELKKVRMRSLWF